MARPRERTVGAERHDGARHAVRTRRQGCRADRRAPRREAVTLESHLRARRGAGCKLLAPYVTGGLGSGWLDVVRAIAAAAADAIDIGSPFSDPVMDGLTIQEASRRAPDLGAAPSSVIGDDATRGVAV